LCHYAERLRGGKRGTWSKIIRRTAGARGLTAGSRKSSATS